MAVDENAWHSVIEVGDDAIPFLDKKFDVGSISDRKAIIKALGYMRSAKGFDLIRKALNDPSDDVWKQGLDAAVSMGGRDALELIRNAIERRRSDHVFVEWSNEAAHDIENEKD